MINPDSFIEEVTEEVRRDKFYAALRRYGWIGVLAVFLLVGGAAWNEWQKAQARSSAQAFGDAVLDALDAPTAEARRAALSAVQATGDRRAVLALLLASDPDEDRAGTIAALQSVEAEAGLPAALRDLAVLRRVILQGADVDLGARRAALDPLAAPGRPYRPLALEQLAYLAVEAGDRAGAVAQLTALTTDQEAPVGLRRRAQQMIPALGGTAGNDA